MRRPISIEIDLYALASPSPSLQRQGYKETVLPDSTDQIYRHSQPHTAFEFDEKVVSVFPDMIKRSVPGYATIISMIGMLAQKYQQPRAKCYDLGCSLGAATLAMRHHLDEESCRIVAVDNSEAMIKRCRDLIDQDDSLVPVELHCADINEVEIDEACMVVLNFTLQFVPVQQREALLKRIYEGLLPGGMLVLSEKVQFQDPALESLFVEMYHRFKMENGYSEMEVSQKRAALENVLIPETIESHEQRICEAGFSSFDVWFQCFNFASMVAVKR